MVVSRKIFAWHHWCGLIAGLFLLSMSISGAILVFTPEIEFAYQKPWLKTDNPAGIYFYDASFARVRTAYPDWEIRLAEPPRVNEVITYDLRKGQEIKKVFAHPVTGAILHVSEGAERRLHRQLLSLHYTLFAGTAGKMVVFTVGLLFFISLVTGIFIYRKAIAKVLRFKWAIRGKTGTAFYSSLHRITGVWTLLFNLLIVTTGLFISGDIIMKDLQKNAPKKEVPGGGVASIDRIKIALNKQYPDFTVHFIRVAAKSGSVEISGRYHNDPIYYGRYNSRFIYNGGTGVLVQKLRLSEQLLPKRLKAICQPLHFGNYGGLLLKCFYCAFGLMPGLLSISGFLIWKKKTKKTGATRP